MQRTDLSSRKLRRPSFFAGGEPLVFAMVLLIGAGSAVVIKEFTSRSSGPALAAVEQTKATPVVISTTEPAPLKIADPLVETAVTVESAVNDAPQDLSIRWFNGRAIRPAKTINMLVTAYSPDERSCAGTADGITASNHDVRTNAHRLVAADSKVLPLGSMITIPGYDNSQVVPVLDRGGAIKGNRLDVLFPTHEEALKWGARRLKVTVWEYADGQGADNWRAIRDSKN